MAITLHTFTDGELLTAELLNEALEHIPTLDARITTLETPVSTSINLPSPYNSRSSLGITRFGPLLIFSGWISRDTDFAAGNYPKAFTLPEEAIPTKTLTAPVATLSSGSTVFEPNGTISIDANGVVALYFTKACRFAYLNSVIGFKAS